VNEYNYNFEITKNLKMFEHVFDDIEIRRYEDMTGRQTDRIKVNFIYGPKMRVLQDINGKTKTVKFPAIAMQSTGMQRDDSRIKNKINEIEYVSRGGTYTNLQAVPWNINVQLSIISKFQQDVEQIVQHFAVFTNPYVAYAIQEPKTGNKLNVEVHWDGAVNIEYPGDNMGPELPYRIIATANFTIKTWLFRANLKSSSPICYIYDDIIPTNMFSCDYAILEENANNTEKDSYYISGKPQLRYVNKYYFRTNETPKITITGDGFKGLKNLYLVPSDSSMYELQTYTLEEGVSIEGYEIKEFTIPNTQTLSFSIPTASAIGFVDVVAINECGWSRLTTDANRCNRVENPYPVTDPEHYNWCVQQFPHLNGLVISNNLNDDIEDVSDEIIVFEEESVDRDSVIEQIKNLMSLADISVDDLT